MFLFFCIYCVSDDYFVCNGVGFIFGDYRYVMYRKERRKEDVIKKMVITCMYGKYVLVCV